MLTWRVVGVLGRGRVALGFCRRGGPAGPRSYWWPAGFPAAVVAWYSTICGLGGRC